MFLASSVYTHPPQKPDPPCSLRVCSEMETAWILLFSVLCLCVRGTPLSSLSPLQDSDVVTPAASSLNIDMARTEAGHRGPDLGTSAGQWSSAKAVKRIRQTPNTDATTEEDVSEGPATANDDEKTSEEESPETWLSALGPDDVPKQMSTMTSLQDSLMLPALGLLPRDEGSESVWTEAARTSGAYSTSPQAQDEATESTMSLESQPLIFEPLEDVSPEEALSDHTVTVETDSEASPPQTSTTELQGPIRSSDSAGASDLQGSPQSQTTVTMTTVAMITQHHTKSRARFNQMESDEDADEDEENSEESVEDSEEVQTGAPGAPTPPPYNIIPPPPVWVQHNQGLMRSWVELIREKAGYVSGMLAPVGIGISGALLLVGALYSIRIIHRKRRDSFKHQRRKSRQPEPREPGVSGQDQAMLLADSSEDEF
uniref:Armadillo-like helical domain-containing protein 4 n=1 Tax=Knipowitschia caucasica TaxID=637954 RepID=A0AAV2KED8_KNICA